jgi:hypothetical protein
VEITFGKMTYREIYMREVGTVLAMAFNNVTGVSAPDLSKQRNSGGGAPTGTTGYPFVSLMIYLAIRLEPDNIHTAMRCWSMWYRSLP